MLRIGKLTDYALLIMSHMAREPSAILSATFLAETLHLAPPTVSKILKILAEAGLLHSVRGAEGGYHLARAAGGITVADVITAMEGLAVTACCEQTELCAINSLCMLRENWQQINSAIQSLLASVTIVDMLTPLTATTMLESVSHVK